VTLYAMRALARAVDAKDSATGDHSLRVARLVERLARAAGWDEEDANALAMAGLVHDVGKLGIPESVLLKPGKLDEDEYRLVKHHPHVGAEMLANDGPQWTPLQVEWVLHHHERPDGRGYPDGVDQADLSDGAALLALADSYDVMTSARPYKPAMPPAVALVEVERLCGRQFVHFAVRALERVHGELVA
jgi:HD-GYP domain-containing protein (c-di-GMP phosphodiesterase class II)